MLLIRVKWCLGLRMGEGGNGGAEQKAGRGCFCFCGMEEWN